MFVRSSDLIAASRDRFVSDRDSFVNFGDLLVIFGPTNLININNHFLPINSSRVWRRGLFPTCSFASLGLLLLSV
jgi:hypothetical protein